METDGICKKEMNTSLSPYYSYYWILIVEGMQPITYGAKHAEWWWVLVHSPESQTCRVVGGVRTALRAKEIGFGSEQVRSRKEGKEMGGKEKCKGPTFYSDIMTAANNAF